MGGIIEINEVPAADIAGAFPAIRAELMRRPKCRQPNPDEGSLPPKPGKTPA
jgi:hypothetical protein